jgi:transcriptional regulator with XRE-family HTH domain
MGRKPATRKSNAPRDLPELCVAVRKLRAAAGLSQEAMGQRVGLALQTVYRFEAGLQTPRDYGVLTRLRDCAMALGLTEEANLFDYELQGWRTMWNPNGPNILTPLVREGRSPEQHRLGRTAELAVTFFPDAKRAAEAALAPVLELYDEAFKAVVRWNTVYDAEFYRSVEAKLNELVKQKLFHTRKKRKVNREER